MSIQHKHAAIIKAWADGAVIQRRTSGDMWIDDPAPQWHEVCTYRVKAEINSLATTGWPKTTLSDDDLARMFVRGSHHRNIANEILANATQSGVVIDPRNIHGLVTELAAVERERKRENMELGKAERLLESLGYRSAGQGEWTAPQPVEITREPKRDMYVARAVAIAIIGAANNAATEEQLRVIASRFEE